MQITFTLEAALDPAKSQIASIRGRITLLTSELDMAVKPNYEVLKWLVPHEYNTGVQSDHISRRATGTYQWFLDSSDYQTWISTEGKVLFCHGSLGVGKSVLASTVIASLQESQVSTNDVAVCYFYFSGMRAEVQSIDHAVRAMLWQLVHNMPTIPKPVVDLLERHETEGTRPATDEVREAFCAVASCFSRLFVVIDALNEYRSPDDCQEDILSLILGLQVETGANMFLTSRSMPQPREMFLDQRLTIFRASDKDIEQSVRQSIHRSLSRLAFGRLCEDNIVDQIVSAAEGV